MQFSYLFNNSLRARFRALEVFKCYYSKHANPSAVVTRPQSPHVGSTIIVNTFSYIIIYIYRNTSSLHEQNLAVKYSDHLRTYSFLRCLLDECCPSQAQHRYTSNENALPLDYWISFTICLKIVEFECSVWIICLSKRKFIKYRNYFKFKLTVSLNKLEITSVNQ